MNNIVLFLLSLLNYLYPKSKDKILFISSPDLSDNSFALFKYMMENLNQNKQYIWLVDKIDNKDLYLAMIRENIPHTQTLNAHIEILDKKSLKGMLAYIQSKYIFFTHGFYTGIRVPMHQVRINLWHGMPLKAIGYLNKYGQDKTIPRSSIVVSSSELYQRIMAKAFNMTNQDVWVSGQPRCDLLFSKNNCLENLKIKKNKYKKIIFWAPTYRYAKDHNIQDGNFNESLPILEKDDLSVLDSYLMGINSYMIIKLHPMDILNNFNFNTFTSIKVLKDEDLLKKDCQLYSLLSEVDILITDYSSIYIDFLLLNKPIIFAIDDFEEYKKTRDFVFQEPEQYMPGHIVSNITVLKTTLNDIIINNNDKYAEKRKKVKKEFHKHDNSFSVRLIESLKL